MMGESDRCEGGRLVKLEKWQREKLRELFSNFLFYEANPADESDADKLIGFVEQVLALEPEGAPGSIGNMLVEDAYKRFMAEWKKVGVWQGGKPVRAKLARLAKAGQLGEVWAGLERLRNDPNRPAPEYVPRPMTWLNQERWNDDPYPAKSGGRQAAAGAVLNIQLDGVQSVISPAGMRELARRSPSILGEMQQRRW